MMFVFSKLVIAWISQTVTQLQTYFTKAWFTMYSSRNSNRTTCGGFDALTHECFFLSLPLYELLAFLLQVTLQPDLKKHTSDTKTNCYRSKPHGGFVLVQFARVMYFSTRSSKNRSIIDNYGTFFRYTSQTQHVAMVYGWYQTMSLQMHDSASVIILKYNHDWHMLSICLSFI